MFLKLNHQNLDVFQHSKQFVLECYKLTNQFPSEEKYNMISQIRRAALSVYLNVAEGSSRKSEIERKRFYEISRSSIVEVDAAFDIAFELGYFNNYDVKILEEKMINTFKLLTGLIKSAEKN